MISTIWANKRWPGRLLAGLFWLLVWQWAANKIGQPLLLPSPFGVAGRLAQLLGTGAFWGILAHSLLRIFCGFALGLCLGTLLAVGAFFFRPLAYLLAAPLSIIKASPVASFIILALVWLPSPLLSVFIAFLMVLPPVYENITQGLASPDLQLLEMAKVYHLPPAAVLRHIYLPATLPFALAALRTSLGLAWKSGVAGEVLAIPTGAIGTQLYNAKVALETVDLFAWTAVIILLSILLEWAALWLLKRWIDPRKEGPLC